MKYLLSVTFLIVAASIYANPEPVISEYGEVQGYLENGLTIYKGVPFAAAPVGDLRWKAPQPHEKWEGVLQATEFAPNPYQGDGTGNVSEDCLYINIWSPAKNADERLPVLVWIYGGGFSFGSSTLPVTNGQHLARKGVILATINYRVGPLGFLAHPDLSAESPQRASGNYGLQDQIAGLKWIQRNIAAFGGDPDKVTIFGESAGGISVSMLSASSEARGLFVGAISQSGGSFGPTRPTTYPGENMKTLAQAEAEGVDFARRAGATTLEELRKLPPGKLPAGWGMGSSWPIVDGWIIPDDQYRLYEAGEYNDVNVLIGYNSDEGLFFSREKTPEEFVRNTRNRYGVYADKLLEVYPAGEGKVSRSARNLTRDAAFGWHTWSWARLQASTGKSKVFFYYFDQHPDFPKGSAQADHGAPHGADIAYVFQTYDPDDPNLTEADIRLSENMARYWVNFAKFGDPNGAGLPEWPEFTNKTRKVMVFRNGASVGALPDAKALEVLDDYFAWRRTPEGRAWAD
jgi:para-nitrobenzyl esterase